MAKFILKRNDTTPSLEAQLLRGTSDLVVLAGATVVFNMRSSFGVVVTERANVTIVDALQGIVRYDWVPSDTSETGAFIGEFEVTFADGKVETFPKTEVFETNFIPIIITTDLA